MHHSCACTFIRLAWNIACLQWMLDLRRTQCFVLRIKLHAQSRSDNVRSAYRLGTSLCGNLYFRNPAVGRLALGFTYCARFPLLCHSHRIPK